MTEERTTELAILRLLAMGELKQAAALAAQHDTDPVIRPLVSSVLLGEPILRQALGRPRLHNEMAAHNGRSPIAVLLRSPQARRLVVVFSGNTLAFALPKPLITRRNTNVLLIRDPNRCFAMGSLNPLGETYYEIQDFIRRVASLCRAHEPLVFVGISAGGYPALRYGLDMGASAVLGFSAPTTLNLDDDPGAQLSKYPQLAKFYRYHRSAGLDVAADYREAIFRPFVRLIYSPEHDRDAWLASRMIGLPGVEATPIESAGHRTFPHIYGTPLMEQFVDEMLSARAWVDREALALERLAS